MPLDFIVDRLTFPKLTYEVNAVRGIAKIARAGVLTYTYNGHRFNDYRPIEVIQSLTDQASGLSVTLNHPLDFVDSTNYRVYNRGSVLEADYRDGWLEASLVIQDAEAMAASAQTHTQFSIGAWVEREMKPGVWVDAQGVQGPAGKAYEYDRVQRKLELNHLSLVDLARAGHEATWIVRDREDPSRSIAVYYSDSNPDQEKNMSSKTPEKTTDAEAPSVTEERIAQIESNMLLMMDSLKSVSESVSAMSDSISALPSANAAETKEDAVSDEGGPEASKPETKGSEAPKSELVDQFAELSKTLTTTLAAQLADIKQSALSGKLIAATTPVEDADPWAEYRKSIEYTYGDK